MLWDTSRRFAHDHTKLLPQYLIHVETPSSKSLAISIVLFVVAEKRESTFGGDIFRKGNTIGLEFRLGSRLNLIRTCQ